MWVILRIFVFALFTLLTLGVGNAQTPSVARMGVRSTTTPQQLLVQDKNGSWVPISFFTAGQPTPFWALSLSSIASTVADVITRIGYATAGDAPPLNYISSASPCSIGAGAGDGGSQIRSSDGKCWLAVWPTSGVDVREYGATCDGSTDITAPVQAALNYGSSAGLPVLLPPGRCYFTGVLTVPSSTALVGALSGLLGSETTPASNVQATVMLVTNTSSPFITVSGQGSTVKNLMFYYPNQVAPTASTPTAYPFTIKVTGYLYDLENLHATNAYNFMDIEAGRGIYKDSIVGAYNVGLQMDYVYDWVMVDHVMNQVMWDLDIGLPYPQAIDTWVENNSYAAIFYRADSVKLTNFTAFSRYVCLFMTDSSDMSLSPRNSYGEATNIDCDSVYEGVEAKSTNTPGWRISNLNIGANPAGAYGGVVLPTGGTMAPKVTLGPCAIRGIWSAYAATIAAGNLYLPAFQNYDPSGNTPGNGCQS